MNVKKLTACALFIALATILSLIKIYRFPFGGDITALSMLEIVLPAWIYGVKTGAMCGLIFGGIQFVLGAYIISVPQVILDYVLAFSVMGVAGVFSNQRSGAAHLSEADFDGGAAPSRVSAFFGRHSLQLGYSLAIILRWIIATAAGLAWIAAGSTAWSGWAPLPYSMAYTGAYISTEGILTLIVISMPPMKKVLAYIKQQAL